MKKRFLVLAIAIMFILCPILTACGGDIVGTWNIAGYSYQFNGEEKTVTLEEADALIYDENVSDIISEQFYLNKIKYINDSREQSTFEFKGDGTLVMATLEFKWSYDGENIVVDMDENLVYFTKLENGQLKMVYPVEEIIINIMLEK